MLEYMPRASGASSDPKHLNFLPFSGRLKMACSCWGPPGPLLSKGCDWEAIMDKVWGLLKSVTYSLELEGGT